MSAASICVFKSEDKHMQKAETLDLEKLLSENKGADPKKVQSAREALKALRECGVAKESGYNIVHPFSRRAMRSHSKPSTRRRHPGSSR